MKKGKATMMPDFLVIPYPVYCDPRLEGLDRNVYGAVYWLENLSGGKCIAGNETIAKIAGSLSQKTGEVNTRSISNSLDRLEKLDYITRKFKDEAKRNRLEIRTNVNFKRFDRPKKTMESWMTRDRKVDDTKKGIDSILDEQNNNNKYNNKKRKEVKEKKRNKKFVERSSTDELAISEIIFSFRHVTPTYKIFFEQDPQRTSAYNMIKLFEAEYGDGTKKDEDGKPIWSPGVARLIKTIQFLTKSNKAKFAPVITTPSQLERKFGELKAWVDRIKDEKSKGKGMSGTVDDDVDGGNLLQD